MALGSLSGPARVDGAWLWGVHLHVQVGAQRNRRVEPHPAQRAAPGSASVQPRHYVLWSALRWVSRPARLARALDVERVAWPRGEAQPCPGCGLRGRTVLAREPPCDPVNDPTRTRRDRSSTSGAERKFERPSVRISCQL